MALREKVQKIKSKLQEYVDPMAVLIGVAVGSTVAAVYYMRVNENAQKRLINTFVSFGEEALDFMREGHELHFKMDDGMLYERIVSLDTKVELVPKEAS